jgi:hypothetical protein
MPRNNVLRGLLGAVLGGAVFVAFGQVYAHFGST